MSPARFQPHGYIAHSIDEKSKPIYEAEMRRFRLPLTNAILIWASQEAAEIRCEMRARASQVSKKKKKIGGFDSKYRKSE